MRDLVPGANGPLPPGPVSVRLAGPFDVCALVTGANGKVAADNDFVFYNQPRAPGVALSGSAVTVDPGRLHPGAERVVIAASPEDGTTPFGRLPALAVTIHNDHDALIARFAPPPLSRETVVTLVEIYRRGPAWKIRAVGQGYADGLAGLARDFGVAVGNGGNGGNGQHDQGQRRAPPRYPDSTGRGTGEGGLTLVLARVVTLTNAERAREGLAPLTVDDRLAAAAEAHSVDMATRGFFAHTSPEGRTVSDRVSALGYRYAQVAENIAAGQNSADEVVTGWMNSPGHRANILIPRLRQIGIGQATGGEYGFCWTQVFGTLL
ncbi:MULTISPECIES: CAP domain-containing protein [unclassified Frankia]